MYFTLLLAIISIICYTFAIIIKGELELKEWKKLIVSGVLFVLALVLFVLGNVL